MGINAEDLRRKIRKEFVEKYPDIDRRRFLEEKADWLNNIYNGIADPVEYAKSIDYALSDYSRASENGHMDYACLFSGVYLYHDEFWKVRLIIDDEEANPVIHLPEMPVGIKKLFIATDDNINLIRQYVYWSSLQRIRNPIESSRNTAGISDSCFELSNKKIEMGRSWILMAEGRISSLLSDKGGPENITEIELSTIQQCLWYAYECIGKGYHIYKNNLSHDNGAQDFGHNYQRLAQDICDNIGMPDAVNVLVDNFRFSGANRYDGDARIDNRKIWKMIFSLKFIYYLVIKGLFEGKGGLNVLNSEDWILSSPVK